MKFKEYLFEKTSKKCVFAFGRMNPPTTGHQKLVEKVKAIAKSEGGDELIVLSHSQDPKKNPLTPQQKLEYVRSFFPGVNFDIASKAQPSFLAHASNIYKKGYTEIHMVAGSDRIAEYEKLLNQYNGKSGPHGFFKFNKIVTHSAGERDPDAEGVEGMSASKMREAAKNNDFKHFKMGVPSNVSDKIARKMMTDVRSGMNIKESFDTLIQNILLEGVHDKGIFKAMFLAGGPGSGKDYVLDNTLAGHGLTEINSDKALEFLMDKRGLDKKMPESEKEARDLVRGKAKDMTELRQRLALLGRNGLIINGTGDDPKKIAKIKARLEELGYETGMIMVNTADEVSKQRNIERGQRGGRTVPEEIRKEKWDSVQAARPELAKLFGDRYKEFDNSEDLRTAPKEVSDAKKAEMLELFKGVKDFVSKPAEHPKAQEWIAGELSKKDTLGVPKSGTEMVAPQGDSAADQARKLGLKYYGYGRYGKDGKVTHHSVHGRLVKDPEHAEQQKMEKKAQSIPVSSSSQPLKVKESIDNEFQTLFEAITVSITADTQEELNQALKMLTGNGEKEEVEEETYKLSDTNAFNALTLGKSVPIFESFTGMKKVKQGNDLYIALNGKPRVYVLRNSAAKDAHRNNGEVVKVEKGYMVKLKENVNVELSEESIQAQSERGRETSSGWSNSSSGRKDIQMASTARSLNEHCGCETDSRGDITGTSTSASGREDTTSTAKTENAESAQETKASKSKITLAKIKENFRQKVSESIDKGIEPGLSMAGAGESLGRDMGEINDKSGKVTPLKKKPIRELTGDETGASIGDQKEDELKKKGISLTTFKKRNYL